MLHYVLRRGLILLSSLLVASFIIFMVLTLLPGDAASVLLGTEATPEALAAFRQEMGLTRPWWIRYGAWLSGLVRGDLGVSFVTHAAVGPQVLERLQVTVPLALYAILLATLLGCVVGMYAASSKSRLGATVVTIMTQVGVAVPAFWAGILLILALAIRVDLFPAGGTPGFFDDPLGALYSLTLPAVSLALVQGAILSRYVRAAILEIKGADFMRTAQAKGLTSRRALMRHGLRNAAIPIVTVSALQFGQLVAGTVVIENVYVLPGLGRLLLQSVGQRDLQLLQGALLVIVAFILVINFLLDVTYRLIDPRLRPGS